VNSICLQREPPTTRTDGTRVELSRVPAPLCRIHRRACSAAGGGLIQRLDLGNVPLELCDALLWDSLLRQTSSRVIFFSQLREKIERSPSQASKVSEQTK